MDNANAIAVLMLMMCNDERVQKHYNTIQYNTIQYRDELHSLHTATTIQYRTHNHCILKAPTDLLRMNTSSQDAEISLESLTPTDYVSPLATWLQLQLSYYNCPLAHA